MAWKYNPFTDALDNVGSGGGTSYIDGEVEYHSNLPVTVGTPAVNSAFLVRKGEGLYFISRKPAGIWVRELNNGNLDDWKYAGTFSDLYRDANFRILNNADVSKELAFDLSGITTGTVRTLTAPNASGRIQIEGQPIGNTTPAAGTFTTLTANNGTLTASAPVLDLAQTWNASGTTFTGLNLALTNTASASASSYFNINLDGGEAFSIRRGESNVNATLIRCGGSGLRWTARTRTGGGVGLNFGDTLGIGASLEFLATASGTTAGDVALLRDGASDTLAQRRTTNAQTFRIYNTFTSDTNHERLRLAWASNVAILGTEKGSGGGTARNLEFQTDGVTRLTFTSTGQIQTRQGLVFQYYSATASNHSANLQATGDGVLRLTNNGNSDFNRVQFGGTDSTFPALKRSSTTLQVRLADDSAFGALEALSFTTANSRIVCDDTNNVLHVGNTPRISLYGGNALYLSIGSNTAIRFSGARSDQPSAAGFFDLIREADHVLAQRSGTNAQTFRLYNTVSGTGNVNFDRVNFRWASNEFIIDAEAGGTGTLRGIKIGSATSSLLGFYGVTPVDQPATVADPAGGGTIDTEARAAVNAIIDRLQELGLIA
jgi:hypothetical protein